MAIPDETSEKPDSQVGSSFSKLMAEVGGAWRIFIFMSFTASLFAFIYMVILRYLGGVIIWVSNGGPTFERPIGSQIGIH